MKKDLLWFCKIRKILLHRRWRYYKICGLKRFNNLPIVYGDKENFKNFYAHHKKIKFPYKWNKIFYFFESNRWDLITIKDKIVKLPKENYVEHKKFLDIKEKQTLKNTNLLITELKINLSLNKIWKLIQLIFWFKLMKQSHPCCCWL